MVNVNFSLHMPPGTRRVEVQHYPFLNLALDEVRSQPHALPASPPGERCPGTHSGEGWVGHRTGLDDLEERKIS